MGRQDEPAAVAVDSCVVHQAERKEKQMATGRGVLRIVLTVLVALALFGGGWLVGRLGIGSVVDPASLTEAERQFTDGMRNVALVGTFSVAGKESSGANPDRYEIASVDKVGDDLWRFNAKMSCCGLSGSEAIPITVPMRWVGDTPVIMMTDASLPGVGTFTVRLFFYGDRYAGTWQHGAVGGHMSGRIEKQAPPKP
jgi:hypothetical protein